VRVREPVEQASLLSGPAVTYVAHDENLVSSQPKYIFGDTFEIAPHPRLLRVLGDIIFSPWACVAEMVDLAYFSLLDTSIEARKLTVAMTLPSSAGGRDRELVIRDDGIGMEPEWLLTAVREGFHGAVGERNFGFLMMSLKLGNRLVIRTTRTGDSSWAELSYGVVGSDAFIARACRVAKDEPTEHGTEIIISDLRSDLKISPEREHQAIRERLGEYYSYLLREGKLEVILNGQPVRPRRPCIWDASRTVKFSGASVSAVQEINQVLPATWICRSCGFQYRAVVNVCAECQSQEVFERSRRVWGWLGVQRYLHVSDFGIDFLRNGRKILCRDKTIFTWREGWDSQPVIEYPVDVPMAGRIVGEIHCDHVPVNYTKEAFEYDSLDWQEVVRVIRGSGPLSPVKCKIYGYPVNDSPLARIVKAFRRNDPGARYLTPGDGTRAIHERARMWAAWFHEGRPEFQTDQIWYDAALFHDQTNTSM
jgi:hypothetical protein